MLANTWETRLRAAGSPEKAHANAWFFKTGPGEYGEGDRFLGLTVPQVRLFAGEAKDLSLKDLEKLLKSPWHEIRLFALIVLTNRAKRFKTDVERIALAEWLFARRATINNWDLVDTSIPTLFGGWKPSVSWKQRITKLLYAPSLWDRRMAILTTFGWMKLGDLDTCFEYAEATFTDKQDLMHKAVGWMLRETGKRDSERMRAFVEKQAQNMPRTTLRYAIEHWSKMDRLRVMKKKS
ncbi:DNA alkylation repair protein [Patescibacteria group bacterium]|nr:DNA alkylation repair protein [Patescibacteria group bacterium]